jgi:hypothetical protein
VSKQSEPTEDLVERVDNYYVYLKPHDADDAAILRKMKLPGKPPGVGKGREIRQPEPGEAPMVAMNPNWRRPPATPGPTPPVRRLAERIRHSFARHPEVSAEEFLLAAARREVSLRDGPSPGPWSSGRTPLTEEDIRVHAWLNQRLAALHRDRHGLVAKVRRFLFGNWLVHRPAG